MPARIERVPRPVRLTDKELEGLGKYAKPDELENARKVLHHPRAIEALVA